jgi:hypothetical protein
VLFFFAFADNAIYIFIMSNRKYTEEHIREWSEEHFPLVDTASDNADMEKHLRNVLIEGSTYFDKYPTAANRTLHKLKPINRYRRYFTNRSKAEYLGFENFHYLCDSGGSKFTNEYQFATLLCDYVSDEVVGKSVKLLKQYGLQVF